MIGDVQQRIVKLRNEIKAQKVARELTYSQLLMPENTPSITYRGTLTHSGGPIDDVVARCRVRFTRTDGVDATPFVNFPFVLTLSPTYQEYEASIGVTVTGDDPGCVDEQCYVGYIADSGDNWVDFYVDLTYYAIANFDSFERPFTSLDFSFTVEAISTVPGRLTVERVK